MWVCFLFITEHSLTATLKSFCADYIWVISQLDSIMYSFFSLSWEWFAFFCLFRIMGHILDIGNVILWRIYILANSSKKRHFSLFTLAGNWFTWTQTAVISSGAAQISFQLLILDWTACSLYLQPRPGERGRVNVEFLSLSLLSRPHSPAVFSLQFLSSRKTTEVWPTPCYTNHGQLSR